MAFNRLDIPSRIPALDSPPSHFKDGCKLLKRGGIALALILCVLSCQSLWAKGKKPPRPSENIEDLEPKGDAPVEVLPENYAQPLPEPDEEFPPLAELPALSELPELPQMDFVMHRVWVWQETRDCLWKLAKLYYDDPWKWKAIYLANRNAILDPNIIFPKQKILIPKAAK